MENQSTNMKPSDHPVYLNAQMCRSFDPNVALQHLTQVQNAFGSLKMMIGINTVIVDKKDAYGCCKVLSFKFKPSGFSAFNYCRIVLNASDLYCISLAKMTGAKTFARTGEPFKEGYKILTDIYAEDLKSVFESESNLLTTLF